eukprot:scaffold7351_cov259-Pinguiococcus_pyrenoidosus.AAC.10
MGELADRERRRSKKGGLPTLPSNRRATSLLLLSIGVRSIDIDQSVDSDCVFAIHRIRFRNLRQLESVFSFGQLVEALRLRLLWRAVAELREQAGFLEVRRVCNVWLAPIQNGQSAHAAAAEQRRQGPVRRLLAGLLYQREDIAGLRPLLWLKATAVSHDGPQHPREAGMRWILAVVAQDGLFPLLDTELVEGMHAGAHVVQDEAEAVDVGPRRAGLLPVHLWRHVAKGAQPGLQLAREAAAPTG